MIRYLAQSDRGPILFIGLSDGNISRLRAGQPITLDPDERLKLSIKLVIYHGLTEEDLTRELEEHGLMPKGAAEKVKKVMSDHEKEETMKSGGHDYHPGLPGFHEDQLFVDGCQECERRVQRPMHALVTQDAFRVRVAWQRALLMADAELSNLSQLERIVYAELREVAIVLDKIQVLPYGTPLPSSFAELVQEALAADTSPVEGPQ